MNAFPSGTLSPAFFSGLAAFILAGVLGSIRIGWAVGPLAVFVGLCLAASFFPTLGFFLPVVCRGNTKKPQVALTFDDGPDPATTPVLLDLLDRHGVKAAFFVTGEKANENRGLVRDILKRGHSICNHSWHHDPLLMLHSFATIVREIQTTQQLLKQFDIRPVAFRPPVGITNPKLAVIVPNQNLFTVNFSCRGNDFGNRRIAGLAQRVLRKVQADDIIMLHDICPVTASTESWLQEIEEILCGLSRRGLAIIPLPDLIGRPVMIKIGEKAGS